MDHSEIQLLLGAYALDALEPDEAAIVSLHVETCPRCRAEVEAHREVAALLGNAGAEAPEGLWEEIASRLELDPLSEQAGDLLAEVRSLSSRKRKARAFAATAGFISAAAAVAVIVLALQVGHLNDQVHRYQSGGGVAAAASAVLSGPHQTITLDSASHLQYAKIAVASDGEAFWVYSNLARLGSKRTYQLWVIAHNRVVSLGVIGPDPQRVSAFRLQPSMDQLMVTAEPEGGTSTPTQPVILQGKVS